MEQLSTDEIQKMLQELESKDDERRIEAVHALGDLKSHNDRVINALKSVATQEQNPEIRQAAANALRALRKARLDRTFSKYSFIFAFVGWYAFNTLLALPISRAGEVIGSLLLFAGFFLNIGIIIFFSVRNRRFIPGILVAIVCNILILLSISIRFNLIFFWFPFYQWPFTAR